MHDNWLLQLGDENYIYHEFMINNKWIVIILLINKVVSNKKLKQYHPYIHVFDKKLK